MSDREAEREPAIKVTDRRHFDSEGRRRTEVPEEPEQAGVEAGHSVLSSPSGASSTGGRAGVSAGNLGASRAAAQPGGGVAAGQSQRAGASGTPSGTGRHGSPSAPSTPSGETATSAQRTTSGESQRRVPSQPGGADSSARSGGATPTAARSQSASQSPRSAGDPRTAYRGSAGVVDPSGREPLTFQSFVESLFIQAMMQLGAVRTQDGRVPEPDVEAAQDTIDIIGLLQEKTQGNLNSEEQRFIEDVLYELRMAFLAITQRLAGAAVPPPPGAKRTG
jgi:hypothetical protein